MAILTCREAEDLKATPPGFDRAKAAEGCYSEVLRRNAQLFILAEVTETVVEPCDTRVVGEQGFPVHLLR